MKSNWKKVLSVFLTAVMICSVAVFQTACGNSDDHAGKFALSYARGAYIAVGDMPATEYYKEGETVTLAPADTFTLPGYTFAGWDDGETVYEGGAAYIMPGQDVQLIAIWSEGDPNAGSVSASSVGFDGSYFVFTGTVKNVEKLYVYLNNTNVSASADNYVEAEITGDMFTARLPLDSLIGFNQLNIPFNLRYKIDNTSGEIQGVAQGSLNLSDTHTYNEYSFRLAVNSGSGCVAVYYTAVVDETVSVSASSIAFDDGYFVVTGTTENVQKLYIYLTNTNVSASADNYVDAEITGDTFTARLPLDNLIGFNQPNIPFNLRYRANGSKANVNIGQGNLDITQTCAYGGNNFRIAINNGCVAVYYAAAPVESEPDEPDYTFSVTDMYFTDGKFMIEGTCGADVEKLVFHLHNTNAPIINFTSTAAIEAGKFKAEFVLSEIKNEEGGDPPKSYINVRYELNDDGYKTLNLLPGTNGTYTVGQEYRYGDRTWTLNADSNRTYLNWSDVTDAYRITAVRLELVGDKPTLTIAGTTADATIDAANLRLLLDKTSEVKEQKYFKNAETEAGKFCFTVDLTDMIASANEIAANKQEAYFIRLYNGSTKLADINSRWASDLLWEKGQIETDDAVYFLMKNTALTESSWYTLGICKFKK